MARALSACAIFVCGLAVVHGALKSVRECSVVPTGLGSYFSSLPRTYVLG
jgi:hypothetical protein